MDRVKLVTGDTGRVEVGGGTHSDRTMRIGGMLLVEACGKIVATAKPIAAGLLDCEIAQVRFEDGVFSAGGSNRTFTLSDVVAAQAQPLSARAEVAKRVPAHPAGCAVCEVEVDPNTGSVEVVGYTSIDDVGQPINPMIVDGQVHGGIAMGIGEALREVFSVDPETGQVTSASFMDYAVTRASSLPRFRIALVEDPTAGNPLRVKGGGECGVTPAAAAVINAVVDALSDFGVEHIDLPATPQRGWEMIRSTRVVA
jgi:carbon-monoxide dehydrogenase large subunit